MILLTRKVIAGSRGGTPVEKTAVVVKNGEIIYAGTVKAVIAKFPSHRRYSLENAALLPGLVNVHTHLELPPLLETVKAETFVAWILRLIAAKRQLGEQDYHQAVSNNISAMIRTGTTTVGEISTHGVSRGLLLKSGLRGCVFEEIISMSPAGSIPKGGKKPSPRASSLIQKGLSPHTPYTVSEPILKAIAGTNRDILIAMHVAESIEERLLLQGKTSNLEQLYQFANWDLSRAPVARSSFEYLDRTGILSPRLLAVHAVHVNSDDLRLIKMSGTSIAHCPRSNQELKVGRMPLKKFLNAGVTVGLGTDSLASVATLNMWDEMRAAYAMHKRDGVTAKQIFRMATSGGAKALGLEGQIGSLEPGKKADIIAVPLPERNSGDIYSDLTSETKSCMMTMVNGKILYRAPH